MSHRYGSLRSFWTPYLLLAIGVLGAVIGGGDPAPAQAARAGRLSFAYPAISGSIGWLWVSREAGLFQKNGLQVDLVYIPGVTLLTQSMLSGETAVGIGGGPVVLEANAAGAQLTVIAGVINAMMFKIMSQPEIRAPADLRGKRIGISRLGTSTDFAARFALRKFGLQPDREVTIVQVGGVPNILAALQARALEAGVLSAPVNVRAKKLGFRELADVADLGVLYPFTYVMVLDRTVRGDPVTMRALVKAMTEGAHLFKTNREVSLRAIEKYTLISDREALEETYANFSRVVEENLYMRLDGLAALIDEVAPRNPRVREIKPERLVQHQFVRELEESGFVKALYGRR